MTHEEFTASIRSIPDIELAEMAHKQLSQMCSTGGRSFTMTVPPRKDDTDIVLSEIIRRFVLLCEAYVAEER
jgi:hypothetical protein